MNYADEIKALSLENARLIALLEHHGIEWRLPEKMAAEPSPISAAEKIKIFRTLFRGRTDMYPLRKNGCADTKLWAIEWLR